MAFNMRAHRFKYSTSSNRFSHKIQMEFCTMQTAVVIISYVMRMWRGTDTNENTAMRTILSDD